MVARNEDGSWSEPTFFTIGSISFGLQAGGEASEIVLARHDQSRHGAAALNHREARRGSLPGGRALVGGGAKAQTATFSPSRARAVFMAGSALKARS